MGSRRRRNDDLVDRPRAARSRRPMDDDLPPGRSSSRSGRGGPGAPPSRSRADYPGGGGSARPPRREEDYRDARPRSPAGGAGGSSDRRRYDDGPPPRSSRSSSRDDYDMRPRNGARPPSRGGRDEMEAPRRPRDPAPMPDARGMRPPSQRYGANRHVRDWDDDEDEPSAGGTALKALGVMILFFAIGVGAAFGYYRMSAPKVIGEETPVTSPTVAPSASPSVSPNASPSATKTSFHFDPTAIFGV